MHSRYLVVNQGNGQNSFDLMMSLDLWIWMSQVNNLSRVEHEYLYINFIEIHSVVYGFSGDISLKKTQILTRHGRAQGEVGWDDQCH